jgi:hypothetical protein
LTVKFHHVIHALTHKTERGHMAEPKSNPRKLESHSLLVKLLSSSGGADAHVFRGYIGPSSTKGRVRLYPSLGDLTFSIEIAEEDIIESAAAPERLLPYGGTVIWVRPDAEIAVHGEQVTTHVVRSLRRDDGPTVSEIASPTSPRASRFVEVRQGRLQIRVRPRSLDTCASCSCSSCSGCKMCSSTCKSDLPMRNILVGR